MTQQTINTGTAANDRKGDSLRAAFTKINANFTELYNATGGGLDLLNIASHIIPSATNTYDLGSPTRQWRSMYVGLSTLYINNIPISLDNNGNLTVDGDPVSGGGGGSSLVNGASSFGISSDGTLTLTHPAEPNYHPLATTLTIQKAAGNYHTISGAYGLSLQATPVPSGYGLNTNTNFVDIFHDGVSVNVNDNTWGFGTDGKLTLPNGSTIGDGDPVFGIPITTARGSILIGNQAECLGGENHFHIMKGGQQAIDLFLGDDSNYVKLPSTGGVEISSSEIGAQHYWRFGTDGDLTLPEGGDILNSNGDSVLGGSGINYWWNVNTTQYTITEQYRDTEAEEYWVKVSGNGIQNEAEGLVEAGLEYRFRLSQDDPGVFRVLSGGIVFTGGSSTINLADLADINYVGSTISTVIRYNTVTELVNGEGVNLSLVNNNKLVITSTSGVDGLTGDTTFEPLTEGQVNYELDIQGQNQDSNVTLRLYRGDGTGPNSLGPGISLGKSIGEPHRAGVVAIGNDDVGYNSKQGGVYIGAKAGWNNVEGPQGEFAIAIGTRAAYTFAHDGTITLNATGENLDPQQADSLYIKPIREVAENTAKAVYYNTTTGEVTYADGGSYTPDDAGLWNDPTVNTVQAALDELAAKVAALQNFEIDGGNANTPAVGELLIDGNGA